MSKKPEKENIRLQLLTKALNRNGMVGISVADSVNPYPNFMVNLDPYSVPGF
jgi:hypothetical protein